MSKFVWDEKTDIESEKRSLYETQRIVKAEVSGDASERERSEISEGKEKLVSSLAEAVRGREVLQSSIRRLRKAVVQILEQEDGCNVSCPNKHTDTPQWQAETDKLLSLWEASRSESSKVTMNDCKNRLRLKMALARSVKFDMESVYATISDIQQCLSITRDCISPQKRIDEMILDCLKVRLKIQAEQIETFDGSSIDATSAAAYICLYHSTERLLSTLEEQTDNPLIKHINREDYIKVLRSESIQNVIKGLRDHHTLLSDVIKKLPERVHLSAQTISWMITLLTIWLVPLYDVDKEMDFSPNDSIVNIDIYRALRSSTSRDGVSLIVRATENAKIMPSDIQQIAEKIGSLALVPCAASVIGIIQKMQLQLFRKETHDRLRPLLTKSLLVPFLDGLQELMTCLFHKVDTKDYQPSLQAKTTSFYQTLADLKIERDPSLVDQTSLTQSAGKYIAAMAFIAARTSLASAETRRLFHTNKFTQAELDAVSISNVPALTTTLLKKAFQDLQIRGSQIKANTTTELLRAIVFVFMPTLLSTKSKLGALTETPEWRDLVRIVIADWAIRLGADSLGREDEELSMACSSLAMYLLSVSQEMGPPLLVHLREQVRYQLSDFEVQLQTKGLQSQDLPQLTSSWQLLHPILHKDSELTKKLQPTDAHPAEMMPPEHTPPKLPMSNAVRLLDDVELTSALPEKSVSVERAAQSGGFSISGLLGSRASSAFLPTLGSASAVTQNASLSSFTARLAGAWR